MTLVVGLIAHRLKTVRLLATATTLMVLSGIGYAFETEFWPLLIIALVGSLSPTASDVSMPPGACSRALPRLQRGPV
jgi:hypothetical protein